LQCKAFSEKCRAIEPHQCAKTTFPGSDRANGFKKLYKVLAMDYKMDVTVQGH
jgi:hypothetical protein